MKYLIKVINSYKIKDWVQILIKMNKFSNLLNWDLVNNRFLFKFKAKSALN